MREHFLSTARTARFFTLGNPDNAREFWFVCHGYGYLAARFLERFRPVEAEHRCIVAPEGLSRFYVTDRPDERRVGASWMTREDRLHEIDDYVRYLDAVRSKIAMPKTSTIALGFSQGAATACRWAVFGSAPVDRLIVWGGEIPPDLDLSEERVVERLRTCHLTLVYGTRDEFFTPKIVAATEARLREHDILYAMIPFEGKHEIDAPTLERLSRGVKDR